VWPLLLNAEEQKIKVPPRIKRVQIKFLDWYNLKYAESGKPPRKLWWQPHFGKVELKMMYGHKYVLQMSMYQACVLMQFDRFDKDELTTEELEKGTALGKSIFSSTLAVLCMINILKRNPPVKKGQQVNLEPNQSFKLNAAFRSKKAKVNINVRMKGNTTNKQTEAAENKATHEEANQAKVKKIEVTVVRIMKTRKELDQDQLIREVLLQISFNPPIKVVQHVLGGLVERKALTLQGEKYSYVVEESTT